jgi:hypothetical protein
MNIPIQIPSIRRRNIQPADPFLLKENQQTLLASQWMWAERSHRLIGALIQNPEKRARPQRLDGAIKPQGSLQKDQWGFGSWSWYRIASDFPTAESLYAAIQERRRQIQETKESWRFYIEAHKEIDPLYERLREILPDETSRGTYLVPSKQLDLIQEGISNSYFLSDANGVKQFVVKPVDEDIGTLNNRKGFASPYTESPIRDNMPLYLSSMRETLAYEMARMAGIENVAPRTALAILESSSFYDQLDGVSPQERDRYLRMIGEVPKEKLCSVQEYIPHSKALYEALQDLQQAGLSDQEIAARFDQRDFEDANILLWMTYDTDGHMGNFLVYPKSVDAIGNEILGIKKIDNGLAFPEKNEQLRNNLRYLPNAHEHLSEEGRSKIAALSIESLQEKLKAFGMESASEALVERLTVLKELAQHPEFTLRDIDTRMARIGEKNSSSQ